MMVVEEMAMNLSHLSEEERKIILNVLRRDEELQKQDEKRLKVLNTEIQRIRKNSALKAGVDPGNTCSRCHRKLGIIFDTGDLCPRCHSKVCSFCRDNLPSGKWVCILCHKQLLLRAKNGRWFYDHVKKKFNEEEILGASRIVRESIRRSKAPSIGTTLNNNPEPTGSTSVRSEHLKKSKNEDFESIDSLSLSQLSSVSHIEVRKVHSHAYDDSDSSTEEEEDPEVAMTRVPIQTRSLSIQSSSAFSSQSERTITPSDLGVTTQQRESKDAGYNSHHGRQDGYGLSPDSVLEDPSNTNHHGSTAVPTVLHPDNGSDSFSDVDYTDDLSNDEYGSPPKTDKFDRGKSGDRYDDYYHDSPQSRRSAQSGGFSHDSRHPPLERDRDHYHYHYLNKTAYVGRNSPRSSPRGPSPRRVSPNSGSTPRSSYTNSPTSSSRFPHGDTNVLHEGSSLHSGLDGYNSTSNSASNATSSPRCSSAGTSLTNPTDCVNPPFSQSLSDSSDAELSATSQLSNHDLASDFSRSTPIDSSDTSSDSETDESHVVPRHSDVSGDEHRLRQLSTIVESSEEYGDTASEPSGDQNALSMDSLDGYKVANLTGTSKGKAFSQSLANTDKVANLASYFESLKIGERTFKPVEFGRGDTLYSILDHELSLIILNNKYDTAVSNDDMVKMVEKNYPYSCETDLSFGKHDLETLVDVHGANINVLDTVPYNQPDQMLGEAILTDSSAVSAHVLYDVDSGLYMDKTRRSSSEASDNLSTVFEVPEECIAHETNSSETTALAKSNSGDSSYFSDIVLSSDSHDVRRASGVESCEVPVWKQKLTKLAAKSGNKGVSGFSECDNMPTAFAEELDYSCSYNYSVPAPSEAPASDPDVHCEASDHPADQEDREQLPPQVTVTDHTDSGADGQSIISSELSCSRVAGEDGRDHENIDDIVAAHRSLSGSRSNLNSSLTTSLTSIPSNYSGAGANYGKIPITGDVLFGIDYNYKVGYLEINVKKCRDLAVADVKKEVSNPYIKTYLLPNKTKASKRRTSTKKNTVEPIYDEVLRYTISQSELETRTLWLSVWHSAGLGRNDFLGEVMIPFEDYEFKASIPQWYPLVGRRDESPMMVSYKGELSIALKYVPPDSVSQLPLKRTLRRRKGDDPPPNMGELHVLIKNAKDLTANKSNDTSDPFCKGYLLPDKSSTGKQKTAVCRKTCNPEWLHTFIYGGVTSTELQECCLELTIWDHERVSTNDFLGGLRLSLGLGKSYGREVEWMDSLGDEVIMWQSMLQKPNSWIEGTLALRPTMDYR